MQKFFRGNDRGNAVMTALVLIIILSSFFVSFVPRIISTKQFAMEYKAEVIHGIERSNREITESHDFN